MKIPVLSGGPTMEESSPSQNLNGQIGPSSGGINSGIKQTDESNQRIQYSIPGILHFIQHEWARFEMERTQWELDRAELQARIAFLQGERKGQENLKNDLVRRIKMLEYALKQERAKYHKLKYGTDLNQGDMKHPGFDESLVESNAEAEQQFSSVSNFTWKQSRQMLRQYLQEIGYTDTIIDVRSNRVRTLLGLNNNEEGPGGGGVNGNETGNKRASESQGRRTPAKKAQPSNLVEAMMLDTEAAVMANFEFLSGADVDMEDEDGLEDDLDDSGEGGDETMRPASGQKRKPKVTQGLIMLHETDDVDAEAEEVLNELNLLTQSEVPGGMSHGDPQEWIISTGGGVYSSEAGKKEDQVDSSLGLGELAQLTVNNESEPAYDNMQIQNISSQD